MLPDTAMMPQTPHFCLVDALAGKRCRMCLSFFRHVSVELEVNEIVSLVKIMGKELNNNDINSLWKNTVKGLPREPPLLLGTGFGRKALSNVSEGFQTRICGA
ncbi:hypothetical protein AVEN_77482-1 [Araneus ventricosus]|uniref:Uncharacterized protein n=1 Tax=Araneus ventricosus TaxID=182803 RepID=A0A4Y2NGH7_ARAVE|nr:hypothetical protein AVEN_77482-1 [Araneus ventricosus]